MPKPILFNILLTAIAATAMSSLIFDATPAFAWLLVALILECFTAIALLVHVIRQAQR